MFLLYLYFRYSRSDIRHPVQRDYPEIFKCIKIEFETIDHILRAAKDISSLHILPAQVALKELLEKYQIFLHTVFQENSHYFYWSFAENVSF